MKRSGFGTGLGRNVWGLGATSFFTDLASEMIHPLIPTFLLSVLGAPVVALGIIEGVADSGASLLRLVAGWLSDRVRKRKIFILVGYGMTAAMRPLMGLVAATWQLGAIRVFDRIGKGIRLAPRDALIADSCAPEHRGKAFGVHRALDNLGGVVGMLIAAGLLLWLEGDLRTVFLWTAFPAAAIVLVVVFLIRERPPAGPPAPLRLTLRPFDRPFRWFLLCVTIFTLGNSSHLFLLPRLTELGLTEPHLLVLVWCGHYLIRMCIAIPAGIRADRLSRKRLVLTGWLIYVGVYLGLGLADTLWLALVLIAIYALYWAMAESVLRAMVADMVPNELRGTVYGMYHFCVGLAILPANLAFGLAWQLAGPTFAFHLSAGLALLACALFVRVPVEKKEASAHG